jgi:predicted nucleotidyltransferase
MGISKIPRGSQNLASALFTRSQQRVLGLLFGQPGRSYFATELIALVGGGSGAVQRELEKLTSSGLVTVSRVGNQKHFQANPDSPVFSELVSIIQKTVGLAEPLGKALKGFAKSIVAAFVYGSIAKGRDRASSDIDLMVISNSLEYGELFTALHKVELKLGRKVNPTVYSKEEWTKKKKVSDSFVSRILDQPKVFIIGGEADLV